MTMVGTGSSSVPEVVGSALVLLMGFVGREEDPDCLDCANARNAAAVRSLSFRPGRVLEAPEGRVKVFLALENSGFSSAEPEDDVED